MKKVVLLIAFLLPAITQAAQTQKFYCQASIKVPDYFRGLPAIIIEGSQNLRVTSPEPGKCIKLNGRISKCFLSYEGEDYTFNIDPVLVNTGEAVGKITRHARVFRMSTTLLCDYMR